MRLALALVVVVGLLPTSKTTDIPTHCLMPRSSGTMSPATMLAKAQEGNPGHKAPPPGWHCAHGGGDDKASPCKCHRECRVEDELDEMGIPTGKKVVRVHEDVKCSSFCFQDHCYCGAENCE